MQQPREYSVIKEDQASSPSYVLAPRPPSLPLYCQENRPATHRKRKREKTCRRERALGGGGGVKYINNFVCTGRVPDPTSLFLPTTFLYVNLVTKGAPKFFMTLAPRLTVLDIPYFADAYSRTVHPIDLHNF
jgi:hypothetical protein